MQDPREDHWNAAVRVLRYIKNSPGQGILLQADNSLELTAYCDSDWAGCPTSRRSITGYFIKLGSAPISWRTKKRPSHGPLQKLSTEPWPMPPAKSFGYGGFYQAYVCHRRNRPRSIATIKPRCTSQQIQYSMNAQNTSRFTAILFVNALLKGSYNLSSSIRHNNWPTYSRRRLVNANSFIF